jgi:hypothetical protein
MFLIYIGLFLAIAGAIIWNNNDDVLQHEFAVTVASVMIFVGGLMVLFDLVKPLLCGDACVKNVQEKIHDYRYTIYAIVIIYLGSVFFTLSSFWTFKLKEWTFYRALFIALVAFLFQYQFQLRGIDFARTRLKMAYLHIIIIILCCNYINSLIINRFYLKEKFVWWRDLVAFGMVVGAFCLSHFAADDKPLHSARNTVLILQ